MSPSRPTLGDRSLFPNLEAIAYLAHAAISPPSLPVRDAATEIADDYARRGLDAFTAWQAQRERLRAAIARLIGSAPVDLAFVPNTTLGIVDVALCFPWRKGDVVVVFAGEFPSNVTPWQRAAALFELEVRMLPLAPFEASKEEGLAMLDAELARGVRLVAVSAVEFQTGLRMPIADMARHCHAHGAELFVDGIQACGVVPIDVIASDIDYLACGSHKWLMGLEGAGFLFVHPRRIDALRPAVAGWLSHEDAARFLFEGSGYLHYDRPIKKRADFLEGGNYNALGLAALEASIGILQSIGVDAIFEHVTHYLDELEAGLLERGFTTLRAKDPLRRSAILGVRPPRGVSVVALHAVLSRRRIACSIPDGVLRFAPHWPNHPREIPLVLDAVDASLGEVRGRA